jgi:hypothetical protein
LTGAAAAGRWCVTVAVAALAIRRLARAKPVVRCAAALAALATVAGCATEQGSFRIDATPPAILVAARDAGVRDLRGAYRAAVCRRLTAGAPPCDDVLLRLAGEPDAPTLPAVMDLPRRYRIAFVPGLFSECFEEYARPFDDVERDLRGAGFAVDYFRVSGRGTTSGNAARLAAHFAGAADDARPFILFAYSKGLVDVLEFTVRFPDAARRIAAIVAVAGAANGSPLADDLHAPYRDYGATFPLSGCAAGTGEEVTELRRDVRLEWWRQHGEAVTLPVFALVAAPRPDHVSLATRATYRWLARLDPRNDGRLLWHDQIPPRSYLLGYANADHSSIAVPVAQALPKLAFLFSDDVPRTALIEAAAEIVAWTLARGAATAPR